jgi:hypothetical protein
MKLRCIVWTTITAGLLAHIAMGAEQKGTDTYGGWTPYQFALWNPVQIFGKTRDVYGLRTSIFYGKNRDVYGLDISLFTNSSRNVYGISILGFGNEYYHGLFPFYSLHHQAPHTGDVTGLQIGGGLIGAIGWIYPPIFYYAIIGTHTRDMTGLQVCLTQSRAHNLTGVQISGLLNYVEEDVAGLQLAGLANDVKGEGTSFQISAFFNDAGTECSGMQLCSLVNHARGNYNGLQLGAVMGNINSGRASGLQLGAGYNQAADGMSGAQIAGIMNYSGGDARGFQFAICNIVSEEMQGVQIGAFNYCRRITGVQIGGLNIISDGTVPFMVGVNVGMNF